MACTEPGAVSATQNLPSTTKSGWLRTVHSCTVGDVYKCKMKSCKIVAKFNLYIAIYIFKFLLVAGKNFRKPFPHCNKRKMRKLSNISLFLR